MNDTESNKQAAVVCRPTNDPAVRWFIFAAMMLGFSLWCYSDRRQPPEAWDTKHINEIAGYVMNNWSPWVLAPAGIIAAGLGIRHLSRKLVADTEGIGYPGGKVSWSEFTRLDASLLQSKGILCLYYGGGRKLILDSWKLRDFRQLVAFVEKMLPQGIERA